MGFIDGATTVVVPIVSLFLLQRLDPHRPSYPSSDAKRFGTGLPDLEQRANIKLVSTFEVSIPDILKLKNSLSKTLIPPISPLKPSGSRGMQKAFQVLT